MSNRVASAKSSVSQRRDGRFVTMLASILVVAILLVSVAASSNLSSASVACIMLLPAVILILLYFAQGDVAKLFLSPPGLLIGFIWANILLVPLLWDAGLASHWFDFPVDGTFQVVLSAMIYASVLTLGALFGFSRTVTASSIRGDSAGLARANLIGLALIAIAGALVLLRVGGLGHLLGNLLTKRELLAGLGPLTVLAAAGGVAGLTTLGIRNTSSSTRFMGFLCALAYPAYLFMMGSRFPMMAFALALLISYSTRAGIPRKALTALLVSVIPFSVWYSVSVRKGQVLQTQFGSARSQVSAVLDPFVFGGMDALHTQGAVARAVIPNFRASPDLILGQLTTIIPRSVLPNKRPGMSTVFSQTFFPISWENGSGVPPSILAESIFTWGRIGGLVALLLVGYFVARIGRGLLTSHILAARIAYPFFAVDCIVLAKSGTDAMLQQFFIQAGGIFLFLGLAQLVGAKLHIMKE